MANVYFLPLKEHASQEEIAQGARAVLKTLLQREPVSLSPELPLKVHFGEQGNRTYLAPELYDGIIDFLQEKQCRCQFIETSVLYGGKRFNRENHLKLAKQHGFTRLPVEIADGAHGEDAVDVEVNLSHFRKCSVARKIAEAPQLLVLSHFKGHALAGFGGALKQLSMGCAAKGGKMAMHMGVKPRIRRWLCRRCGACVNRCNETAITLTPSPSIDHEKCIGCGACFSICPAHAVSILSVQGLWNALFKGKFFREKIVEYAYASSHGKPHIYLTYAVNITPGCDCEPRPMRPAVPDIGIFASLDPVAIDRACFDACARRGKRFRGEEQLVYAEKIGVGKNQFELITLA